MDASDAFLVVCQVICARMVSLTMNIGFLVSYTMTITVAE